MMPLPQLTDLLSLYASEKQRLWREFPLSDVAAASSIVWQAYLDRATVFGCGNGGNAGIVANMLNDFSTVPFVSEDKSKDEGVAARLRTINLSESPTVITAALNDMGPSAIFTEQLKMHAVKAGDVLMALSGSGNSANVLAAVEMVRRHGGRTIGISRDQGGKLKSAVDVMIIIPGISTFPGQTGANNFNFHFEDSASAIGHMITGLLKECINAHAHVRATATPA